MRNRRNYTGFCRRNRKFYKREGATLYRSQRKKLDSIRFSIFPSLPLLLHLFFCYFLPLLRCPLTFPFPIGFTVPAFKSIIMEPIIACRRLRLRFLTNLWNLCLRPFASCRDVSAKNDTFVNSRAYAPAYAHTKQRNAHRLRDYLYR